MLDCFLMEIPYAFVSILGGEGDPNLPELANVESREAVKRLMEPGFMRGKYLGACLDSCRGAGMNFVVWPVDVRGLMALISRWREENKDNDNSLFYHPRQIGEMYIKFELPHIRHDACPRDSTHKERFVGSNGIIRCLHRSVKLMRPSFVLEGTKFDVLSQMKLKAFYEVKPTDPSYWDDYDELVRPEPEYSDYLAREFLWDSERPEEVVDACYAIIDDTKKILSFEDILERMNLASSYRTHYCSQFSGCREDCSASVCLGHERRVDETIFPFDGWTLAYYLQKWKEQDCGDIPWFSPRPERWRDYNHERFRFVNSSD